MTGSFLAAIWRETVEQPPAAARHCPLCGHGMHTVHPAVNGKQLILDVCRLCPAVWFDPGEFDEIAVEPRPTTPEPEISMEEREKLAIAKLQMQQQAAREDIGAAGPEETWQWIPGLLGLPVELDAPPVTRRPWVTWVLLVACTAATLPVLLGGPMTGRAIIQEWGFIPAEWLHGHYITILTAFFLHASLFHLLGNMYFLYIFGDNVEDRLGHGPYALLIIMGSLCGDLVHSMFGNTPNVPCVGASAGISAVIAFYAIAYPKVRLGFLFNFGYLFYMRWLRLTALSALVLYVLMQFFGAWMEANRLGGGVAHFAHLGGLLVGVPVGLYFRSASRAAELTPVQPCPLPAVNVGGRRRGRSD